MTIRITGLILLFALSCPRLTQGQVQAGCVTLSPEIQTDVAKSLATIGCGNHIVTITELVAKHAAKACELFADAKVLSCSAPLQVNGLRDVIIDGENWKILFSDPRHASGGIYLVQARNVFVKNLEIAWAHQGRDGGSLPIERRIYSKGTVVSCDNRTGGALNLEEGGDQAVPVAAISIWDDHQGWPWTAAASGRLPERYFSAMKAVPIVNGRGPCSEDMKLFVGSRVLVRHHVYSANAFTCRECEYIAVENVTVRSAPGMGFVFWGGGRGFLLRGNTIASLCAPKCARAEPTVAADGAHFAAVGGGILIEGNDFGWQGDDSVNIHGLLASGTVDGSHAKPGPWLQLNDNTKDRLWLFQKMERVLLFDLGLRAHGDAVVVDVDNNRRRVRLSRVPQDVREVVITPVNRVPQDVVVRNNRFHDHRARGILIAASNATIENNTIERVTMAAIMVPADTDRWFEGPGARQVMIRNNRISTVNAHPYNRFYPSAISAGMQPPGSYSGPLGTPISDVFVTGNTFSGILGNPGMPVNFGAGVRNGRVQH